MRKFYTAAAGLVLVLAIFITTADAAAVPGTPVLLTIGGETTPITTYALTIEELLQEEGLILRAADKINHDIANAVESGMHIEIVRGIPLNVRIDGEVIRRFYARPNSTLSQFVNDMRNNLETDFAFEMADWHKLLAPGDFVELSTITRKTIREVVPIAYSNEYVDSDRLYIGQQEVYIPGIQGSYLVDFAITNVAGQESGRVEFGRERATSPVNAVVHVGTALPPGQHRAANGEVFSYARSMRMEATAYTLSFECTGRHPGDPWFGVTASGMMAQVGVVAVDTNVIPFHTRMYIEGYGFAVAGDRGGAIRGYKVDLFFDTREEVRQFGRRHLQVWILE
jgi:3D (Asp-Asp-Asp) domain-containing protein